MLLKVYGVSSTKETQITIPPLPEDTTLMDFLHQNQFPIASSCRGEGVCRKCVVNENILSCQISLSDFLEKQQIVTISYF